jgi:hypothetical protein
MHQLKTTLIEPKQHICAGILAPIEDYTDAPTSQLLVHSFVQVYLPMLRNKFPNFYVGKQIS